MITHREHFGEKKKKEECRKKFHKVLRMVPTWEVVLWRFFGSCSLIDDYRSIDLSWCLCRGRCNFSLQQQPFFLNLCFPFPQFGTGEGMQALAEATLGWSQFKTVCEPFIVSVSLSCFHFYIEKTPHAIWPWLVNIPSYLSAIWSNSSLFYLIAT